MIDCDVLTAGRSHDVKRHVCSKSFYSSLGVALKKLIDLPTTKRNSLVERNKNLQENFGELICARSRNGKKEKAKEREREFEWSDCLARRRRRHWRYLPRSDLTTPTRRLRRRRRLSPTGYFLYKLWGLSLGICSCIPSSISCVASCVSYTDPNV